MLIAKKISEIRSQLKNANQIAFVPTMGALHLGHLSLIKKAAEISPVVVVSIFVNKTQFNDLSDYQKYPKTIEQDLELLKNSGATHVFLPTDDEIFAQDSSFKIIPTKLIDCLCGKARAGHFDGVALIITKLFNIVKPNIAIFGEKDFQQVAVIKKLVSDFNFDVEIIGAPTLRETSGLAMSSRNQRLSEPSKIKAAEIFRILSEIKNEVKTSSQKIKEILQKKSDKLLEIGFEKIDYLEIRQENNLELVESFDPQKPSRIFIALYLDGVRLIDNLQI
jgi:pantoate--beta-alanine ligase